MLAFEQQLWNEAQTKLIAAREIMDVQFCYNKIVTDEIEHVNRQRPVQGEDRPIRPDYQVLQFQNLKGKRYVHRRDYWDEEDWWSQSVSANRSIIFYNMW